MTSASDKTTETPVPAIEIQSPIDIDINTLQSEIIVWFQNHILTVDSAVQGIILLTGFVLAAILSKPIKARLTDRINSIAKIPFRITQIMHSLTRLVYPAIALIIIFLGTKIAGPGGLEFDIAFCMVVTKLLVAWIIIRIIVQFIDNRFVRNMFAFAIWTIAALSIFGVLDQTTTTLDAFGVSFGNFRISALTVIKGILAIAVMMYGALFLSTLIERRLAAIEGMNVASRVLIGKVTRIFLIITAFLIGITTAGIDLSVLAVFSGAIGLGIGFGLQRGISNLFSGMMLLTDQSIKPGDIIEVPSPDGTTTTFGWVNEMGGRQTEIITRDNKSYLIPNEHLITQQVVNWSRGDTLVRMEIKFGVHYDSDPHEIKRISVEAAQKVERVQETPTPICHIIGFGDSSLDFTLRFWIRDAEKGVTNVKGDVFLSLWDAFKEHGIQIPYPHREMFVHQVDDKPKQEKSSDKKKSTS